MNSQTQSTTHRARGPRQFIRVTHPFHPLSGRRFELVDRRQTWGEDRVYYQDGRQLKRMPSSWTSAVAPGLFVAISAGAFIVPGDGPARARRLDLAPAGGAAPTAASEAACVKEMMSHVERKYCRGEPGGSRAGEAALEDLERTSLGIVIDMVQDSSKMGLDMSR